MLLFGLSRQHCLDTRKIKTQSHRKVQLNGCCESACLSLALNVSLRQFPISHIFV